MVTAALEPPNGGFGWVVVFASVLNNFLMVPLIQNVGLVFKDKMFELDMTITEMLFSLNVHASFGHLTGLVNNILLGKFGFRKVTLAGVTFVFVGLSFTSWIHNYSGFMVTFGLIAGLGVGLNTSSYTLAIKSYFTSNQNKAIGLSMTLTALGPILMPQIISLLIQNYHPNGVILILASIIAHGYIGAILLQPVRKHMVKPVKEKEHESAERKELKIEISEEDNLENEALDELMPQTPTTRQNQFFPPREFMTNRRFPGFRRKDSVISISYEQESTAIMGLDSTLGGSLYSLETAGQRRASMFPQRTLTKTTWWKSEESINLDSCYNLFDEISTGEKNDKQEKDEHTTNNKKEKNNHNHKDDDEVPANGVPLDKHLRFEEYKVQRDSLDIKMLPWYLRWFYEVVDLFGLDIFGDLRYVSIMLGVSVAIFAELNFTMVLPFLLDEYSLTIPEIAAFLSVLGAADIAFRFFAPHIGDCFKLPARTMIILVLAAIIMSRCALLFVRDYPTILGIACLLGCVKGLRVVYLSLVIPSYVPKERLASASAIQILSNSCMSLLGGYILGVTRTSTGSYVYCIIFFDCITALTILMWTTDILCEKFRKKRIIETPTNVSHAYVDGEEIY